MRNRIEGEFMKKYLLPNEGRFYKANLHCHTTDSDGGLSPEQVKAMYKAHGYSILAITDHEGICNHAELCDEDFLIITGYEISVDPPTNDWEKAVTCHLNLFAKEEDNRTLVCYDRYYTRRFEEKFAAELSYTGGDYKRVYSWEGINDIIRIAGENGFFVSLNHPAWSLQTVDDYKGYEGLWAVEIYNHGCVRSGINRYETDCYDYLLRQGKRIFCTAADDNHSVLPPEDRRSDCCGGFVMVKAPELQYNALIEALLQGTFYASTGAEINELYFADGKVYLSCSAARSICMTTRYRRAEGYFAAEGDRLTEAVFNILPTDEYIRFEVEGIHGERAFTNAFYTDELFDQP